MTEQKTCQAEKCKRAYRAKGYCTVHYKKWRRGELPHARYKTCVQETCKKKIFRKCLCEDHFNALYGKKAEAPAAAPATEAAASA